MGSKMALDCSVPGWLRMHRSYQALFALHWLMFPSPQGRPRGFRGYGILITSSQPGIRSLFFSDRQGRHYKRIALQLFHEEEKF